MNISLGYDNFFTLSISGVSSVNEIGQAWVEITCPYHVDVVSSYKDRLWIVADDYQMYTAKLQWTSTIPNVIRWPRNN